MSFKRTVIAIFWLFGMGRTFASNPEIWVEQLEDRIPNTTPAGHPSSGICYLLRVAGGGGKSQVLDLYGALRLRMRDKANNILKGDYIKDSGRSVGRSDIVGLGRPYTQTWSYMIYMEGDKIVFPDNTGGAYVIEGVKGGTYYVDVTFDRTYTEAATELVPLEKEYISNTDPFFRGAILCGTLTLHIGKAKHRNHKRQ